MTKVEEGEFWWGGAVHDGAKMPLSAHSVYAIDLRREGRGNQSAPFFVSSHGRTVWSEEPFAISFDHGILRAEGSAPILLEQHGATLREGYLGGMKAHFPFDGRCPERAFYVTPQFNTWVELRYDHNRQAVLDYAHSLLSNGYAPGVLMIDDTWQEDYGVWRFHPGRFPDPAGMVKELHEMGFAVMVWAVPVVSPDSAPFRKALNTPGALIRGKDGKPVLIEWWNGYSAAIDFTNEAGRAWMREQLSALQKDYGVDGFKFDGGGAQFYLPAQEASGYGFRYSALTKLMREVIADCGTRLLEKPPHYGCAELRNAIAEYLLRYRGMLAQPDCIIIGSGAEYLYGLIVQLLGRERIYGLEDPGYEKIRQVYAANGAVCDLLPMSEDGIRTGALQKTNASVLHITPFHSFPTGITTSAAKRSAYLAWAAERNAILIEDDFDSEFSENKKPLQTLYSMDRRGCVIYVNTFSHSLAPSMRMGYMVLPEALMARYREQLGFYSCSVPLFDQYVLARFISQGYFERHLNRLRRQNKGKPE